MTHTNSCITTHAAMMRALDTATKDASPSALAALRKARAAYWKVSASCCEKE